jgi:hypothetical protein
MYLGALDNTLRNVVYRLSLEDFPDDIRYILVHCVVARRRPKY